MAYAAVVMATAQVATFFSLLKASYFYSKISMLPLLAPQSHTFLVSDEMLSHAALNSASCWSMVFEIFKSEKFSREGGSAIFKLMLPKNLDCIVMTETGWSSAYLQMYVKCWLWMWWMIMMQTPLHSTLHLSISMEDGIHFDRNDMIVDDQPSHRLSSSPCG
jgi:hypothetical protein